MSRFNEILDELKEIHDKKASDYGDTEFANIRASEDFGVLPWIGAMVRLNDKVKRIQQYITKGRLNYEGCQDSMKDIAVYAIIAYILFEEYASFENLQLAADTAEAKLAAISKEIKDNRELERTEGFFRGNLT